ncbi:MAG: heme-dependent oxidative N-demethylase family protein, partial [Parvularcula sp.]
AASLCFPSHWSLRAKYSRPMAKIHQPVPGFEGQMEQRVDRIMNNLRPEAPVWRMNWSLHDEPTLFQTGPSAHPRFSGLTGPEIIKAGFVRIERQTLTKLPRTGAILFTIRTHLDPLESLSDANRRDLAAAIEAMTEAEHQYRGIDHKVSQIVEALTG